jgi:hypothetical protein
MILNHQASYKQPVYKENILFRIDFSYCLPFTLFKYLYILKNNFHVKIGFQFFLVKKYFFFLITNHNKKRRLTTKEGLSSYQLNKHNKKGD